MREGGIGSSQPAGARGIAVGDVRQRHVVVRAHLDQPAHRARKLVRVAALRVQRLGRGGRGRDELHAMIVQDVDQPREAARLIGGVRRPSAGCPTAGRRRTGARARGSRAASAGRRTARRSRTRRRCPRAGAPRAARPSIVSCGSSSGPRRIASNAAVIAASAAAPAGHVEGLDVLERAQPVVDAGVDLDDVEPLLDAARSPAGSARGAGRSARGRRAG